MKGIIPRISRSIALRYLAYHSLSKSDYETDIVGYLYDRLSWEILADGNYEGDLQKTAIEFLLANNFEMETLIDCGANIGTTSIQLSRFFQKVFAIESYQRTFSLLELNTQNNPDIEPIHASLSDKTGDAELGYGDGFLSGASLKSQPSDVKKIKVETTTLDKLFQNVRFGNLFIKLDIEGLEYQTLLGARNIIDDFRPVFFIEINKNQIANGSSDAFGLLADLEFCFFNVQRKYLGKNILLRNLSFNKKYHIVKTEKLIKKHFLYKFLICVPNERIGQIKSL